MAVSGGVAAPVAVPVAVPVAGLTKRFINQKYFLINIWGYERRLESENPMPMIKFICLIDVQYIEDGQDWEIQVHYRKGFDTVLLPKKN